MAGPILRPANNEMKKLLSLCLALQASLQPGLALQQTWQSCYDAGKDYIEGGNFKLGVEMLEASLQALKQNGQEPSDGPAIEQKLKSLKQLRDVRSTEGDWPGATALARQIWQIEKNRPARNEQEYCRAMAAYCMALLIHHSKVENGQEELDQYLKELTNCPASCAQDLSAQILLGKIYQSQSESKREQLPLLKEKFKACLDTISNNYDCENVLTAVLSCVNDEELTALAGQKLGAFLETQRGAESPRLASALFFMQRSLKNTLPQREIALRRSLKILTKYKLTSQDLRALVLSVLGSCLMEEGNREEARSFLVESKQLADTDSTLTADTRAVIYNNYANFLSLQTDFAEAAVYYQKSLQLGNKQDALSVRILLNLCQAYFATGKLDEAYAVCNQAADLILKQGRERSRDSATALAYLGLIHMQKGRIDLAEKELKASLNIYQATVGNDSALSLEVLGGLSTLYESTGRYEEALKYCEQSVALAQKLFGPTNSTFVLHEANRGLLLCENSQLEKGLEVLERCLKLCREIEPRSLRICLVLHNLAYARALKGDNIRAKELLVELNQLIIDLHAQDQFFAANCANMLADVEAGQGNLKDAERLYQQAIKIGAERKYVIIERKSRAGLANVYSQQSRYEEAEKILQGLLSELSPESAQYIDAMQSIALVQVRAKRFADAIETQKKVVQLGEKLFAPDDDRLGGIYAALGSFYYRWNKLSEAEPLLSKGLSIMVAKQGDTGDDIGQACRLLGNTVAAQSKFPQAQTCFARAIAIYSKLGESGKWRLAEVLEDQSVAYTDAGFFSEAQDCLARAINLRDVSRDSAQIDLDEELLAANLALQGKVDAAVSALEKVRARLKTNPTSPRAQSVLTRLLPLYKTLGRYAEAQKCAQELAINTGKGDGADRETLLRQELAAIRDNKPGDHLACCDAYNTLAIFLKDTAKRPLDAAPYFDECVLEAEKHFGPKDSGLVMYLKSAAKCNIELARYERAQTYLKRAQGIVENNEGKDSASLADILIILSYCEYELGRELSALQMTERALVIQELRLGKNAPALAETLSQLQFLNARAKNFKRAKECADRAEAIALTAYGADSPNLLLIRRSLGTSAYRGADYSGALQIFLANLKTLEKAPLLYDDNLLVITNYDIGCTYQKLGQPALALPFLRKALNILRTAKNPDTIAISTGKIQETIDVATMQSNRSAGAVKLLLSAEEVFLQNKLDDALALCRQALADEKKLSREDFARGQYLLSRIYNLKGKVDEAKSALKIGLANYDADGQLRASMLMTYGDLLREGGKIEEGTRALEQSRAIFEKLTLTAQSAAVYRLCLRCLADIYMEQNKLENAGACILQLKVLKSKTAEFHLGNNAPDTVREAQLLLLQKKSEEAIKLLQSQLKVSKTEMDESGAELLEQANIRTMLGFTLCGLSRIAEAIPVLEPLSKVDPADLESASNLRNGLVTLAICYVKVEKFDQAIPILERALTFNADRSLSFRLTILSNLAQCYRGLKRQDDYLSALQSIIALEKEQGIEAQVLEAQLVTVIVLLEEKKDLAAALDLSKELLALKEKRLGADDLALIDTLNSLGVYADSLSQAAAAEKYYERAISLYEKQSRPVAEMDNVYSNYGTFLLRQNKGAQAKIYLEKAIALNSKPDGAAPDNRRLMRYFDRYALCLFQLGQNEEAASYFKKATTLRKGLAKAQPADAEIYENAIRFFRGQRDYATVEKLVDEKMELVALQSGKESEEYFLAVLDKMALLRELSKLDEAEPLSQLLLTKVESLEYHSESKAAFYNHLALLRKNQHRYREAESAYLQCLALIRQGKLGEDFATDIGRQLAVLYRRSNKLLDAQAIVNELLQADEKRGSKADIVLDLLALADMARLQGAHEKALELSRRALALQTELYPEDERKLGSIRLSLGKIFLDQGLYERAATELEQSARDLSEGGGGDDEVIVCFALLAFAACEIDGAQKAEEVLMRLLQSSELPPGALLKSEKALLFRALAYTQLRQKKWTAFASTLKEKLGDDDVDTEAVSPALQAALEYFSREGEVGLKADIDRNFGIAFRFLNAHDTRLAPLYLALAGAQALDTGNSGRSILLAQAKALAGQNPLLTTQISQLQTGKVSSAERDRLLLETVATKVDTYGAKDPEVALATQNRAKALEENKRDGEASLEWNKALALWMSLAEQLEGGSKLAAERQSQWKSRHAISYELSVAAGLIDGAKYCLRSGNRGRAQDAAKLALAVLETSGIKTKDCADQCLTCGRLLTEMCDYVRARKCLKLALAEAPDAVFFARCQMQLAQIAQNEGDLKESLTCSRAAMDRLKSARQDVSLEYADILVSYSDFLRAGGQDLAAIAATSQAISIYEKPQFKDVKESTRLCEPLLDLTELYKANGKIDQARACLDRAMSIAAQDSGTDLRLKADITECAGRFALWEKNYSKARQLYQTALAYRDKNELTNSTPDVVRNLNEICCLPDTGAEQRAEMLLRSCALTDSYVNKVFPQLSLQEQTVFLTSTLRPQMDLLLSTNARTDLLEKTYQYLVRWKGLLVYSLRRQTALLADQNQSATLARLQAARLEKAALAKKAPVNSENIAALEATIEGLEREMSIAAESLAIVDHAARIDTQGFKRLLQANECFIDFYQYLDKESNRFRQAAIVCRAGEKASLKMLDLGPAEENNQLVLSWLQSVTGISKISGARSTALAKSKSRAKMGKIKKRDVENEEDTAQTDEQSLEVEYRQKLTTKIAQVLEPELPESVDRAIIAPDGQLSLVPWSVFLPSRAVTQVNSPREFITLKRTALNRSIISSQVLLVGDVDFNQPGISALPSTRLEVAEIEKTASGLGYKPVSLLKDEATKVNVLKAMPQAGYVHLATHGYFAASSAPPSAGMATRASLLPLSRSPQLPAVLHDEQSLLLGSGLLLSRVRASLGESASTDNTGVLTSEELLKLNLSGCELVSLSACETARGENFCGQGVLGLGSCLMAASPRSVLLSLWKVPDAATEMLMSEFYRQLWQNKVSKSAALKAAQEKVRKDPRYAAAVNWAAWVLIGDL